MTHYVALLRGINVGGKNIIPMTALRSAFEELRLTDVATYIQSGNVLFSSPEKSPDRLTSRIEQALSKQFGYAARVVVLSHDRLASAVKRAPKGFGTEPVKYRYEVIFLKAPLTAKDALKDVRTKEGVDEVWAGTDVLYFSRLVARASQSYISRVVQLPVYQNMTIRNWNTTTKLLALLDAR